MKQALFLIALFALVVNLPNLVALGAGDIEYRADTAGEVVLFATKWCGYCAKTRAFFDKHGIPYTEHDIEDSPEAARQMLALGGFGVPVVVVGDKVIRGYQPAALTAALTAAD